MNIHDFSPNDREQLELMAANFKKATGFNLLDFTQECTKRGKMTELEAQRLRASFHVFVGAFDATPMSDLEIPRWMRLHCQKCDQSNCPIFKLTNTKEEK